MTHDNRWLYFESSVRGQSWDCLNVWILWNSFELFTDAHCVGDASLHNVECTALHLFKSWERAFMMSFADVQVHGTEQYSRNLSNIYKICNYNWSVTVSFFLKGNVDIQSFACLASKRARRGVNSCGKATYMLRFRFCVLPNLQVPGETNCWLRLVCTVGLSLTHSCLTCIPWKPQKWFSIAQMECVRSWLVLFQFCKGEGWTTVQTTSSGFVCKGVKRLDLLSKIATCAYCSVQTKKAVILFKSCQKWLVDERRQ